MIYLSHNLGLILETCDRITVMYSGEAVEFGTVDAVFNKMRHPYTRGLFNSIPLPGANKYARPLVPIPGQLPLPHERPTGCNFGPRCDFFEAGRCDQGPIPMLPVSSNSSHDSRCVRFEEIDWAAPPAGAEEIERAASGPVVLRVENMKKYYEIHDRSLMAIIRGDAVKTVKANEQLDFIAHEAETVAIVGESGCGKSTFAKVMMGLETATDGQVILDNQDLGQTPVQQRKPQTVGHLQMVFQNPFDTLNPSHSVGSQISRVIRKFGVESDPAKVRERVMHLLDVVKLPRDFYYRRPRQLSGGQKQRVGIARAFAGNPRVVVADEPVSALDVSVLAAVSQLLMEIQRENRTTLLFISHDLSLVRYLADRVGVMYLGKLVETARADGLFREPLHPYSQALISANPVPDPDSPLEPQVLAGEVPSPMNPPSGCAFHPRCPRAFERCPLELPRLQDVERAGATRQVACHLYDED
jgi:peptide/nickel transport system ATP-binding protein